MQLWAGLPGARASRRVVLTLPPHLVADIGSGGNGGSGVPPGRGTAIPRGGGGGAASFKPRYGMPAVSRLVEWCTGGVGCGGGCGSGGFVNSGGSSGRQAARAALRTAALMVLTTAIVGPVAWLSGGSGGSLADMARPSWRLTGFLFRKLHLSDAANVVLGGGGTAFIGHLGRHSRPSDAVAVADAPLVATGSGGRSSRTGAFAGSGGVSIVVSPPPPAAPRPLPLQRPMMPVRLTVFIHNRVGWERAYIESLFSSPAMTVTWVPLSTEQMQGAADGWPVVRRQRGGGPTALVLNAMWFKGSTPAQAAAFGRLIRRLSPAVSVFCSDERGQAGWMHETLVAHSRTTLRQYGVYTYTNAKGGARGAPITRGGGVGGGDGGGGGRTSHAIPLGYMAGMFDSNYTARRRAHANATTLASQRRYAWAFPSKLLGKGREPMLAAFRSWAGAPHTVGPRSVTATRLAYESAAFVPNSHGNVVLDCFRLYEASMAGAIPVVVATPAEFQANFGALPELPPWVVAPDWATALAAVRALAANKAKLDARQRTVSQWWWRVNDAVQQLVEDAVVGRRLVGGRYGGVSAGG
ncbi:hypothetical protein MMPV_004637 [Pyropia vietnamensis]